MTKKSRLPPNAVWSIARWDGEELRENVIATQRSRGARHAAMEAGASESWDDTPPNDASQHYVRNHMNWTVAAARYRFPPVKDVEP